MGVANSLKNRENITPRPLPYSTLLFLFLPTHWRQWGMKGRNFTTAIMIFVNIIPSRCRLTVSHLRFSCKQTLESCGKTETSLPLSTYAYLSARVLCDARASEATRSSFTVPEMALFVMGSCCYAFRLLQMVPIWNMEPRGKQPLMYMPYCSPSNMAYT